MTSQGKWKGATLGQGFARNEWGGCNRWLARERWQRRTDRGERQQRWGGLRKENSYYVISSSDLIQQAFCAHSRGPVAAAQTESGKRWTTTAVTITKKDSIKPKPPLTGLMC